MKKVASALSAIMILTLLMLSFPYPAHGQTINAAFIVNTIEDTHDENIGDGVCVDEFNKCSLRAAIEEAKDLFSNHETMTTITFGFTGPQTICLDNELPYNSPANIIGPNDFSVTIDGQNIARLSIGIYLNFSSSTTIKNLRLQHFSFAAIYSGNYYGHHTIERNIIVNNANRGIYVSSYQTFPSSGSISIKNNFIGYDPIFEVPGPNSTYGIEFDALDFSSTGSAINISGNVISGNVNCGILVKSPDIDAETIIQGNIIGTDDFGTVAVPNGGGICVDRHAGLLTIGADTAAEGNLVSGNNYEGIKVSRAVNFTIQNNNLSTNASGTAFLPNGDEDISLYDSTLGSVSDNVALQGISIHGSESHPVTELSILRNYVGITRSGFVRPLTTNMSGIYATYMHEACKIGFNRITGFRSGIYIDEGTFTNITSNKIFDTSGLGIEIPPWGTNPNDYLDADTGPNFMQNFPSLTVVKTDFSSYKTYDITAKLHSTPNTLFRVEVFSSDVCFTGGYGDGEEIERTSNAVRTDGNGNATWQVETLYSWEIVGECFTATASKVLGDGLYGSTSEFSRQVNHLYLPTILR
jgi:CSLREA domain-containing protein